MTILDRILCAFRFHGHLTRVGNQLDERGRIIGQVRECDLCGRPKTFISYKKVIWD